MAKASGSIDLRPVKDASKVADNYLKFEPNKGLMVADQTNGIQTIDATTQRNVLIDADSVDIRDGQNVLAKFGTYTAIENGTEINKNGAQIGKLADSHIDIDFHSMQMIDRNGNNYLHVSDLRDETGFATIEEKLISGSAEQDAFYRTYFTMRLNVSEIISVNVNGDDWTNKASKNGTNQIKLSEETPALAEIIIVYTTNSSSAKAYTFGKRSSRYFVGPMSFAEGSSTGAEGFASHAEGVNSVARDWGCHVEGHSTEAKGTGSHAEGMSTIASGSSSHAEGFSSLAYGDRAHAEGYGTTASGRYAHAEGWGPTASGNGSHAEGERTTASGVGSHAEGHETTASRPSSHAEGWGTTASGSGSHAEGYETTASGPSSHAEGTGTTASGDSSHAGGYYTKASSSNQTVLGKWNAEDTANTYACIIGNGTADNDRSNALTVDWNGNVMTQGMAGMIQMFAGSTAPSGWLICDGTAVSRTTYAKLFAVIGTTYGAGDGSTTFNLPDMRGRFPLGSNTTYPLNDKKGATTITLSSDQTPLPSHKHGTTITQPELNSYSHSHNTYYTTANRGSGSVSTRVGPVGSTNSPIATNSDTHTHTLKTNVAVTVGTPTSRTWTGSGISSVQPHDNMPPYIGINFIIATGKTS